MESQHGISLRGNTPCRNTAHKPSDDAYLGTRRRGARYPVPLQDLTVDDVIAWRYPDRWKNRARDWLLLDAALEDMTGYRVTVNGVRRWLASAWGTPSVYRRGAPLEFMAWCPPGAETYWRFDFWRFVREASHSATRGAMYLALTALLDRSAKHGQPVERTGTKQDRLAPTLPAKDLTAFVAMAKTRENRRRVDAALAHFAAGPDAIVEIEERAGGLKIWSKARAKPGEG